MRKIIAAFNITLDGFCDHTAGIPDEEVHDHYTDLLNAGDVILYGKTTYEMMKYWQAFLETPSEEKSMNDFARAMDKIPKIVFSTTLTEKDLGWHNAKLSKQSLEQTVKELKQSAGKDILVGSRSLIAELTNLGLIDEYQLCIHPVIVGKGLHLFDNLKDRTVFKLIKTKTFKAGAVLHYYSSV